MAGLSLKRSIAASLRNQERQRRLAEKSAPTLFRHKPAGYTLTMPPVEKSGRFPVIVGRASRL
jgi:hypothetical protein